MAFGLLRCACNDRLCQSEQSSRLSFVAPHGGDQRIDAVELLLLADEGVECDFDAAAIEVAVEAEQVSLEEFLRWVEGGADAEAGDAGMLRAIVQRDAHGVDSVFRALVIPEGQVRGRIAQLAAAGVAALDHALDREIAGQEVRGVADVARGERLADPARRHALALYQHRRDGLGDYAVLGPDLAQLGDAPGAALAVSEVVAGHDA